MKNINKVTLNNQLQHWDGKFCDNPEMFGSDNSISATNAAKIFKNNNVSSILELGAGQGRDSLFFAINGFKVHALDYTQSGVDCINKCIEKYANKFADEKNLDLIASQHDVRTKLPFDDNTFDACYSHMLYCMAFTTKELEFLTSEIRRILRPNGLNIYTARNTNDADYKCGPYHGEDLYESNGFVVHYFSKDKIEYLSEGYEILDITEFEEGSLPRILYQVTLRKC